MGDKHVVSIRFHMEGLEADLYRKIREGKEDAGLSMPEYVKNILSEYFRNLEKRNEAEQVLQEIRLEYRDMIGRVERTIRQSIQEHDAILISALGKMNGTVVSAEMDNKEADTAELPEEGGEIPEGALDFLDGF